MSFVTLQFRAWWLLYAGYAGVLLVLWIGSLSRREPFRHALLLAVVVWGGVYFTRTLGRSDTSHLDFRDSPAFTEALIDELKQRGLFDAP